MHVRYLEGDGRLHYSLLSGPLNSQPEQFLDEQNHIILDQNRRS
jgi:hypothetical protein